MSQKPRVLITGANGEVGRCLIEILARKNYWDIVTFDLAQMHESLASKCLVSYQGDIRDHSLLNQIDAEHEFHVIFHLAALLSASGEKNPQLAHEVNVSGSVNLLQLAERQSNRRGRPVTFVFASTIAVYGLAEEDDRGAAVEIGQYEAPITMYGINKLYVERIGNYYSDIYRGSGKENHVNIDFRCLRFPGLISPDTAPSGGSSDYAPEMLHAAAAETPYACFVRADTKLPFMAMPDAAKALLLLARAHKDQLTAHAYNVTSFSVSAEEIRREISSYFPQAKLTFQPDPLRQALVDSWPNQVNDTSARRDWDWVPDYNFKTAFRTLLIPKMKEKYRAT